jgi:hypothetical protein
MVVPKSKFFSKFPISKWSFVNLGLFKSLELTKYIIYSHRTKTLMLQRLGGDIPSSTKVHTWCHVDDNVLMSPSRAICSHHSCFVRKNIFNFNVFFSIVPQSYIHTQWHYFSHCSTILHIPCIILHLHIHIVALPCNLSYFYIFTLLLRSIVIIHLHIPSHFINIIGLLFYHLYLLFYAL